MDNQKTMLEQILRDKLGEETDAITELSLDDLANVAVGVITDDQKAQLADVLKSLKQSNVTLDYTLQMLPTYYNMLKYQYPNVKYEEVEAFIRENWDLC